MASSSQPGDFLTEAIKMGTEGYTKVVITLIDRCFESDGADLYYDNILDIDDPILFEEYKIVKPSLF